MSILLLAFLGALSCATPTGSTSDRASARTSREAEDPFPSPAEIDALGAGPKPEQLLRVETEEVDEWTLGGPLADEVATAPRTPESPYEALLDAAVSRRAGLATTDQAMHCTAREVGRFLLDRGKLPAPGLVEFMAARCGASAAAVRTAYVNGDVPTAASDAEIVARWHDSIDATIEQSLAGGPVGAGLWSGRSGSRVAIVVASSLRRAYVTPFSTVAQDGSVTIEGEVLGPTDAVLGTINHGRYAAAECAGDATVKLPRFRVTCTLAAEDRTASLEIGSRAPGRILSDTVLRALVRRPGEEARTYRRVRYGAARVAADPGEFAAAVTASLNEVRARAGLRALALSKPESEQATQLVPHLVAGSMGLTSPAVADLAVLGLAAGWRVGGTIRDASVANAFVWGPPDAGRWLDAALASPSNRRALLDPEATVIAVGSTSSDAPPALAGVAATYELFGDEDLPALAARVLERIARARADAGLPAPQRLDAAQPLVASAAGELSRRGVEPTQILGELLPHASEAAGRPVQGWVTEAFRVEEIPLPPELTQWSALRVALAVGYRQPAGVPWGRYVVLLVALPPDVSI